MKYIYKIVFSLTLLFSGSLSAQKMMGAEYFWDTDPGQGSGTSFTAKDGSFNTLIETALNSNVTVPSVVGVHKFHVRAKGYGSVWGPAYAVVINIENSLQLSVRDIKIVNAEYFWDTDPGQGNGTAMTALDGSLDEAIETVINSNVSLPSVGVHKFNIRVKGGNNNWGTVNSLVINVENSLQVSVRDIKVINAEYFWDTDPGQGNGTAMIALDGSLNEAIETVINSNITLPSLGVHKFNIRVKGGDNNWGPVFSTVLRVETTVTLGTRNIKVTAGESFWDTDPGQGNGKALIAFDGNFDEAIEKASGDMHTGYLTVGAHVLHTRFQGADGMWGRKFSVVVRIDAYTTPVAKIFGATTGFCAGGSTSGITYAVDSVSGYTYKWTIQGGVIAGSTTKGAVVVNWDASGPYDLKVVECNGFGCDSTNITISVNAAPSQPSASNNSPACVGTTVNLSTATVSSATYSWIGPNGFSSASQNPSISVASLLASGTYTLQVTVNGCTSIAGVTTVTVSAVPATPTATVSNPICEGDTLYLNASTVSNATYSWIGPNSFTAATEDTFISNATTSAAGTYSVSATVAGCEGAKSTAVVVVNTNPAVPTVSLAGSDLVCNYSVGNQWYLDGDSILGATTNTITPTQSGTYIATITNVNGCSSSSAPYSFIYTGIRGSSALSNEISIYPNPSSGNFTISFEGKPAQVFMSITNVLGETVYQESINSKGKYVRNIDAKYPSGVYLVHIQTGDNYFVQRVVIK